MLRPTYFDLYGNDQGTYRAADRPGIRALLRLYGETHYQSGCSRARMYRW